MQDYYQTLGVDQNATPEQIKKAYRSLANKHHPDKGGDQARFKDISAAYETLSDQQKKAEYDQMRMGGPQVRFHTGGMPDFGDIFGGGFDPFGNRAHPFADMFGRRMPRNRDLNIQCQVTLYDSFIGKQLEANYQLPSGRSQTVVINVPPGIGHGETIRYNGLGDDSVPQAPRGNLNVTIVVLPDANFRREGDDVYTTIQINPIEAILGCRKKIKTLAGQEMDLEIRAGVNSGTEYASHGTGFSNPHTHQVGRFVTVVNIETPVITDPTILEKLRQLNAEITSGK